MWLKSALFSFYSVNTINIKKQALHVATFRIWMFLHQAGLLKVHTRGSKQEVWDKQEVHAVLCEAGQITHNA